MLVKHLRDHCADDVVVTQMRPSARRRLGRVSLLPSRLGSNADRLINRFQDYPAWLRNKQNEYDVFHLVDHSYSQLIHVLPAKRTVVTCHDLDTFRCLLDPEREPRPRWFRAMARRILNGFLQAAHVIAVSEATRGELLRHGLIPAERVTVVHNGVHPACSPSADPSADSAAARLLPSEPGGTIWLLSVGSTLPRKRLDVLLRVFAGVLGNVPQARLVRVGGLTPAQLELAKELKVEHAVLTVPFLERKVLAAVYRRATLLLLTSESEGFGLPLIEAMACGCPAIANEIAVLREVGGEAVCYCSVGDIDAWTDAVVRVLEEQRRAPEAWEFRRQKGLDWAVHFSWEENARRTASIYRSVMEQE